MKKHTRKKTVSILGCRYWAIVAVRKPWRQEEVEMNARCHWNRTNKIGVCKIYQNAQLELCTNGNWRPLQLVLSIRDLVWLALANQQTSPAFCAVCNVTGLFESLSIVPYNDTAVVSLSCEQIYREVMSFNRPVVFIARFCACPCM